MKKIAIIGGGIIGQFTAYYLSKSGHEVTIIDDSPEIAPASAGNCGLIVPSHIVPLNSWSTIWKGIKWLGKKDAPMFVKPQLEWTFLLWFLSFARHSTKGSIAKATEARHELLQLSQSLYEKFFEIEINQSKWKTDGLLYVCHTWKGMKSIEQEVRELEKYELEVRMLTKQELLEIEPSIRERAVGGAIFNVDGWLNPTQLLIDIRQINDKMGVKFVTGSVNDFQISKREIKSISIGDQLFQADDFVVCAGAKSQPLARKLGIRLPLIPGKGYNLTINNPLKNQPVRPIVMTEKMVVATPWETGFRLGSTMEFSGFDLSLNERRLQALREAAMEYLDIDLTEVEFEPWAGWRPMTSNSLPLIGRVPKYKNLILATGHGMLGLSMAPATGKMVEEIIAG